MKKILIQPHSSNLKMFTLRKFKKLIVLNTRHISKIQKRVLLQDQAKFDGEINFKFVIQ